MSDYPGLWHEAGHALAALHLGGEVRLVTMESEVDGHKGQTEVVWRGFDTPGRLRCSALVALAGPVAETLYMGEDVLDPAVLSAWRGDYGEAQACLEALAPDPGDRARLEKRLIAELVAHFSDDRTWERLARVADALDAHESLDATLFLDAAG